MLVLVFYVPETHLEPVKNALFEAGAGKIGSYSRCSWQTAGEGQFMPEEGSNPYLGKTGAVMKAVEYRVEMACAESAAGNVVKALLESHPYETPAWHFIEAADESKWK